MSRIHVQLRSKLKTLAGVLAIRKLLRFAAFWACCFGGGVALRSTKYPLGAQRSIFDLSLPRNEVSKLIVGTLLITVFTMFFGQTTACPPDEDAMTENRNQHESIARTPSTMHTDSAER